MLNFSGCVPVHTAWSSCRSFRLEEEIDLSQWNVMCVSSFLYNALNICPRPTFLVIWHKEMKNSQLYQVCGPGPNKYPVRACYPTFSPVQFWKSSLTQNNGYYLILRVYPIYSNIVYTLNNTDGEQITVLFRPFMLRVHLVINTNCGKTFRV